MKFIQTLYVQETKDPFFNSYGWAAPEYHVMSWALSCLQLRHLYGKVTLHANSSAARLLIDTLELPYQEVQVTHDALSLLHESLWALPKIHTYSLQSEPFLHIDGDVFLFKPFANTLLHGELIAQNFEEATDYYLSTQQELMQHFTHFPPCVNADFASGVPIRAVNAGILGGHNLTFIQEYTSAAFNYIHKNASRLSGINVDRFNVFFEQHLFYSLAKEKGVPIHVLFQDTISDNEYIHLGDFHEVPRKINYLHLLGHFKRDEYTCMQMAAKLRSLYPEYYYKIVSLFKSKEAPFFISLYQAKPLEEVEDYLHLKKFALENYLRGQLAAPDAVPSLSLKTSMSVLQHLSLLKEMLHHNGGTTTDVAPAGDMEMDYLKFTDSLLEFVQESAKINPFYLYGRDIEAANWYASLFFDEDRILEKCIAKCPNIAVLESEYDWSGLLNKSKRVGVKYYEDMTFAAGQYYNLIIPEVYRQQVSLFDLEELEKKLLDHLAVPISVYQLLIQMQVYVDDEVLDLHLDLYHNLLISLLKQLVLKKAVRPIALEAIPESMLVKDIGER